MIEEKISYESRKEKLPAKKMVALSKGPPFFKKADNGNQRDP